MKLFTVITLMLFAATIRAQDPIVAFSAVLNTSLTTAPSGVVMYDLVAANSGNWYDTSTGGFTIPEDNYGIYYMGLSIGVPGDGSCNTNIHQAGTGRVFTGIKFANTYVDGIEYASRGFMRELPSTMNRAFEVQNEAGCSLVGDPYKTSSWTMFLYRDLSELSISFSLARRNDFTTANDHIDWQIEFVNDGVGQNLPINATTGYFTAPVDAYYFFHVSSMSRANTPMQAMLVHWPASLPSINTVGMLNREYGDADGEDTTSRSLILNLNAGDQMSVGNIEGSILGSSNDGYELSFSGFAYANNTDDPQAVVFCAYMINWEWISAATLPVENWSAAQVNFAGGSPVPPFNLTSGEFTAPTAGTYFVSFSVGVMGTYYSIVGLTDGDTNEIARIDRRNTYHTGMDTLSRDIVVDLAVGDKLILHSMSGSGMASTLDGKETSFMAMRMRDPPPV